MEIPANAGASRRSNSEFATEFKARTKRFAVRILKMGETLPSTLGGQVVGRQLVRSATSVAANYRAACRARSTRELAAKLHIALEEADESELWLELLEEAEIVRPDRLTALHQEVKELVAILTNAERSARLKAAAPKSG